MIKQDPELDENTTIYTNSNKVAVYYAALTEEQCMTLVDQMLNTVNSFASNGSGWIIKKLEKIVPNVDRFSPVTACFYMKILQKLYRLTFVSWICTLL